MNALIIRGGRVIDPANKRDEVADVFVDDGKIVSSLSAKRNAQSTIEEIDANGLDRGAGLDRHARASARAGIRPQGNNRIRHARSSSRRIHDGRLHAKYFSGGRYAEHDCLDQRSRGEQRVCACLADGRDFKRSRR